MRRLLYFSMGLMAGAAIGAGLSWLFAPASGEQMRQDARQQFNLMLEESARAAAQRREELEAELAEMTGSAPQNNEGEDTPGNE